jgi:glycosyltransferase involved in cell wall biosynthesis
MEKNPLFSVLIANYNNGKYLIEAVDSVRNQTYDNWEIVILDDGSTDNSYEIYKELEMDKRIRIYSNDVNRGVGYTKRRLCELALGEIAGFLDADDALVDVALNYVVDVHVNNDLALVYSNKFNCCETLKKCDSSSYQIQIPQGQSYLDLSLGRISHFACFRLNYYNKTEGINPFFLLGEDQDLYFKLEEVGSLKYIDIPLYKYRTNPMSISNASSTETIAWGIFAKYEACKRRGLDPAKYISNIIKGEKQIIDFYENSTGYRMGNIILKPYRMITKYFRGKQS